MSHIRCCWIHCTLISSTNCSMVQLWWPWRINPSSESSSNGFSTCSAHWVLQDFSGCVAHSKWSWSRHFTPLPYRSLLACRYQLCRVTTNHEMVFVLCLHWWIFKAQAKVSVSYPTMAQPPRDIWKTIKWVMWLAKTSPHITLFLQYSINS